jgi:hypothetical protein
MVEVLYQVIGGRILIARNVHYDSDSKAIPNEVV